MVLTRRPYTSKTVLVILWKGFKIHAGSLTKYLPKCKYKYSSTIALWYLCMSIADWTRHFILYMYSEGSRFESLSDYQVSSFRVFMVLLSPSRHIPRQHFKLGKYLSLLHISNSKLLSHTRLYRKRR